MAGRVADGESGFLASLTSAPYFGGGRLPGLGVLGWVPAPMPELRDCQPAVEQVRRVPGSSHRHKESSASWKKHFWRRSGNWALVLFPADNDGVPAPTRLEYRPSCSQGLTQETEMGTTHDALERAEQRSQRDRRAASLEPGQEEARPELDAAATARFVADHGAIKNNVLALGADGLTKRLLLINTLEEGESAACALRFAASLTEDSDLEVLVVDLKPWTLSLREVFRVDHTHGLLDLFSEAGEKAPIIEKPGPGDLYTARLGGDYTSLPEFFESGGFDRFLDSTNERFDFVILDMPGGVGFQECRALCAKVDAAALVLQSGVSAEQVALGAKKYIENPADKLLGVIVDTANANRRKPLKVVSTVVATCLVFGLGFLVGDLGMEPGDAAPGRLESAAGAEAGTDPPRRERAIPLAPPAQTARAETARAPAQEAPAAAAAKPADSAGLRPDKETRQKEALAKEAPVKEAPVIEARVTEARIKEARVKEAGLGEGLAEEAPATEAQTSQATAGQAEEGRVRTVVVSQGDNLYRIILGAYGTYNEGLLRRVLDENPEIPSSKKILVGRTIRLPRLD